MKRLFIICFGIFLFNCNGIAQTPKSKPYKVLKSTMEWKSQLSDKEYYVLREEGTEHPFTSPLNKNYKPGTYMCKGCNTPLFKSEHKFDSGTGWPSFDSPIKKQVGYSSDTKLGYKRHEVHCATCGSHLGHVFNDGPSKTTGKRYCINGVSLKFIPKQ